MPKPLVVITDTDFGTVDIEEEILLDAGFELKVAGVRAEADVAAAVVGAEGLLVQFATVGRQVFETAPSIKALVRYGAGLDTIDLVAAAEAGVEVAPIGGYCTDEVADHAMALLLAVTRGVAQASISVEAGEWLAAEAFGPLTTLRGKRLGLVGFGRIGQAVAARAAGFGMEIGAFDPGLDTSQIRALGAESLSLDEAFRADVVSLHLPLSDETRQLVNADRLASMPEHGVLLNTSRGGLVDDDALVAALDAGRPAFAALDVLTAEPPPADHPLVRHPRVIVTPHLGFFSTTSLHELRRQAAHKLVDLIAART